MELKNRLNNMLLQKLRRDFEDYFDDFESRPEADQREMLPSVAFCQAVVRYMEEKVIPVESAVRLLESDDPLDDLCDAWEDRWAKIFDQVFSAFLLAETATLQREPEAEED